MENEVTTQLETTQTQDSIPKKLFKRWFIDAFTGMAQGLFVTLIAGTILEQIGKLFGQDNSFGALLILIAKFAKSMMGAGIGAGIAKKLKAPDLVIFGTIVAGLVGAFLPEAAFKMFSNPDIAFSIGGLSSGSLTLGLPGNPIGSYVSSLMAVELGILIAGKTKLDILLVPLVILITCLASIFIAIPAIWLISLISKFIEIATGTSPFIMGILISVVMGVLLTMPTSSAAIWIAIAAGSTSDSMLLAAGASVVGCSCQMVGFAVMSYKENGFSGLISQGIGTSMLQIPNIMKHPQIIIPPIVASAILGPMATTLFKLRCTAAGGGMGTSGFVGIFGVIDASTGVISGASIAFGIILLMIVLPALISWGVCKLMRMKGWIKEDYLKL